MKDPIEEIKVFVDTFNKVKPIRAAVETMTDTWIEHCRCEQNLIDLRDACSKLIAIADAYRAGLEEIAKSKYCSYAENGPALYGIGVTDGHRYCATLARRAIEKAGEV